MAKACLIIIFNHRYDRNIPILEKIYSPNFSNIYFLVPFYNGDHPRVIPVYESSHYFQSYFAQAYHRFFKEEFTHYIFTGDDCLLNPSLNEYNFLEQTGLAPNTEFIPGFIEFHKLKNGEWWHAQKAVDFFNNRAGAEVQRELPSKEEAIRRFQQHGIGFEPLTAQNIFGDKKITFLRRWQSPLYKQFFLRIKWKPFRKKGKFELPYPVVGSYSDVLIVTHDTIKDFCRYCGIMAAVGLFVEIAIPTSLLLSSNKIAQEKDLSMQGKALWLTEEIAELESRFNGSISQLSEISRRSIILSPRQIIEMEQRPVKKFIVITSIFPPTEAIEAFSKLKDHHLIVVGDKKTPANWHHDNCTFLDVNAQIDLSSSLATVIPFNHYGRKMIGYVYAMQQGADIIIDTDDDNVPYGNWQFPSFEGSYLSSRENLGWVNIYHHFSDQPIWPRGLPLRNINDSRERLQWQKEKKQQRIGIWQGLADDDPDVDAIYRLTSNKPCTFQKNGAVVLEKGTVCPFNSQNTAIIKELFPLLFLPSFVTFRFTDILRGIIAQPILWHQDYRLGFTEATVIQKRNEHDYFKDFESEVPMYLHAEKSLETVSKMISGNSVKDNLYNAYEALLKINVVEEREMTVLNEWLKLF